MNLFLKTFVVFSLGTFVILALISIILNVPLDDRMTFGIPIVMGLVCALGMGLGILGDKEIKEKNEEENKSKIDKNKNDDVKQNNDASEELKKYKKMLEDGLIEQDDYDAKKKELLNL